MGHLLLNSVSTAKKNTSAQTIGHTSRVFVQSLATTKVVCLNASSTNALFVMISLWHDLTMAEIVNIAAGNVF
jgi:hypothetical protein